MGVTYVWKVVLEGMIYSLAFPDLSGVMLIEPWVLWSVYTWERTLARPARLNQHGRTASI